jgi:NADH pyrophosphatase NudC (nudix superfamily)
VVQAIVSHNTWYCQKCKAVHSILFIDDDNRFCPKCVTDIIKNQAEYVNQNREQIEYKEI